MCNLIKVEYAYKNCSYGVIVFRDVNRKFYAPSILLNIDAYFFNSVVLVD